MNKKKLFGRRGLRGKLILLCTTMVVVTAVSFAVISFLRMGYSWKLIKKAGRLQNETIKKQSQDALTDLTNEAMLDTIDLTAKKADGEFWTLRHDFAIFASQVQAIFDHPEQYGEQEVCGPDPANKGKFVLQITFANPDAEGDPYTREMAGKLANLAPMMTEIIRARREKGITQKQLEALSGVKQPVIARMESGESDPRIGTVMKALAAIGMTLKVTPIQ